MAHLIHIHAQKYIHTHTLHKEHSDKRLSQHVPERSKFQPRACHLLPYNLGPFLNYSKSLKFLHLQKRDNKLYHREQLGGLKAIQSCGTCDVHSFYQITKRLLEPQNIKKCHRFVKKFKNL